MIVFIVSCAFVMTAAIFLWMHSYACASLGDQLIVTVDAKRLKHLAKIPSYARKVDRRQHVIGKPVVVARHKCPRVFWNRVLVLPWQKFLIVDGASALKAEGSIQVVLTVTPSHDDLYWRLNTLNSKSLK